MRYTNHMKKTIIVLSLITCVLGWGKEGSAAPCEALLVSELPRPLTQDERTLPEQAQRLILAYPDQLRSARQLPNGDVELIWFKGPTSRFKPRQAMVSLEEWDQATEAQRSQWWGQRDFDTVLNHASLGDQLLQHYPSKRALPHDLPVNFEPGRVRDEDFFKRVYGINKKAVGAQLTSILWGQKRLRVTRLNCIHEKLALIYRELNDLARSKSPFYSESAGAFVWRMIKGTRRLSVHSFGAAIDVGVKKSNYWKWTLKAEKLSSTGKIPYRNQIPIEVVSIFERYGFIWGGWWYHHDTMHFEYRPELLIQVPR